MVDLLISLPLTGLGLTSFPIASLAYYKHEHIRMTLVNVGHLTRWDAPEHDRFVDI